MRVTNVEQAMRAFGSSHVWLPPRIHAALMTGAESVRAKSRKLCPLETGALRESHKVVWNGAKGSGAVVSVVVGGPTAPYALWVHEDLTKRHPVGQAKFLAEAMRRQKSYCSRVLTRAVADGLRKSIDGRPAAY